MLTAISCGVTAPMSRPIGAWTRFSASAGIRSSLQRLVDARDLGAAADQAEIAQVARRQRAQRVEVVGVAARDDRRRRRAAGARARDPGRDVLGDDLGRVREALAVGELLAVVDDVDAEADLVRQIRARWKPTWPAPMT